MENTTFNERQLITSFQVAEKLFHECGYIMCRRGNMCKLSALHNPGAGAAVPAGIGNKPLHQHFVGILKRFYAMRVKFIQLLINFYCIGNLFNILRRAEHSFVFNDGSNLFS